MIDSATMQVIAFYVYAVGGTVVLLQVLRENEMHPEDPIPVGGVILLAVLWPLVVAHTVLVKPPRRR